MPTASGRDVHHDTPLARLAIKAFEGAPGFAAQRLFPVVNVSKQSDRYYIIEKDAWTRRENARRAPGTPANRIEFSVSSNGYFADNYALAHEIPIEDLANSDDAIQLRQSAVNNLVESLLRDLEVRVANLVTSISNVGSGVSLTGASAWTATQSADIVSQIQTAHAFISQATGFRANTLVLDRDSYELARVNQRLLNNFRYTDGGMLSDQALRTIFGVDRIVVSDAVYNTAQEGKSASMSRIFGSNALLCYVNPNAVGRMTATFGLAFRWRPAGAAAPFQVTRSTENQAGSKHVEVIEVGYYQDEKIVAPELAYLIKTA